MAMCLYEERDGYYRSGKIRVGRDGDFYTSSSVGTIMAVKLAAYIGKLAGAQEGRISVVEWGAGTGRLSRQLLAAWEAASPAWLHRMTYRLVDGNPVHLEESRNLLREYQGRRRYNGCSLPNAGGGGEGASRRREMEPSAGAFTILLANELLDAFPVHRVAMSNGQLWELGVGLCAEATIYPVQPITITPFREVYTPLSDPRIEEVLRRDGITLREGQILEVNLHAEDWILQMSNLIGSGCMVLIDYGHEAVEYAAPHRMRGTLLCYKDHIAQDEPYLLPGEQDMTAHVNFTACMAAAADAGWRVEYYHTQKQFLVDQGLLSDLMNHSGADPFSETARNNRAIRQLLLSDAMSETFKVLVLGK